MNYKFNSGFKCMRKAIEETHEIDLATMRDVLCDYLLGTDYYIVDPVTPEQANLVILCEILDKYSKQWRKDIKKYRKLKKYIKIIDEVK